MSDFRLLLIYLLGCSLQVSAEDHASEWMIIGGDIRASLEQYAILTGRIITPNASQDGVATWPDGIVHYVFDGNVTDIQKKLFLDAAAEWSSVAGVSFVPRTTQAVFLLVKVDPGANGGYASLGRCLGGVNTLGVGSNDWTRYVLLYEIGHALGLIHEHQCSDRDNYITINCANLVSPDLCSSPAVFGKLNNSRQVGIPYDFLSIMHYFPSAFQASGAGNVIEPKAAYAKFAKRIGAQYKSFIRLYRTPLVE